MSEKLKGTVKWFNDAKGFGFIEHESGKDVFVHYSVIASEGFKTLKDGEPVEYELGEGQKGLHATKVMRVITPQAVASQLAYEVSVESSPSSSAGIFPIGTEAAVIAAAASEEA